MGAARAGGLHLTSVCSVVRVLTVKHDSSSGFSLGGRLDKKLAQLQLEKLIVRDSSQCSDSVTLQGRVAVSPPMS